MSLPGVDTANPLASAQNLRDYVVHSRASLKHITCVKPVVIKTVNEASFMNNLGIVNGVRRLEK